MHELRDVMIHHALTIAHAQSTVSSIWPPARPIPLQVGGLAAVKPTAISVGITEADVVTRVAHHAKTNAFQLGQLFGSNRYCPATLPHACCTTRRTTECGGLTEAMQPQCAVWHRWECWKIAHGTLVVPGRRAAIGVWWSRQGIRARLNWGPNPPIWAMEAEITCSILPYSGV